MPQYRVTIFMNQASSGPSETWISKTNVSSTNGRAQINSLLDARAEVLPRGNGFAGCRIGIYGNRRASILLYPGQTQVDFLGGPVQVPSAGRWTGGDPAHSNMQYGTSLQLRLQYSDGRSTQRYLAGVPRDIIVGSAGGLFLNSEPTWRDALASLNSVLISNWGLRARLVLNDYVPTPIIKWRQRAIAPLVMGAVVGTIPDLHYTIGERVSAQGVRRKDRRSLSFNGQYYIDDLEAGPGANQLTVWLRDTAAGDASTIKLPGTLQRVGFGVVGIDSLTPIRLITHKRGRPTLAPRGKRSIRLSLDP